MSLNGWANRLCAMGSMLLVVLSWMSCTTFDDATLPPPQSTYLSLEEGARACGLVASCPLLSVALARSAGIAASASSYSTCLHWLAGPLPVNRYGFEEQRELLKCVAEATDCAGALACAWIEPLAANDPRCIGFVGDRCDSLDVLVDCDEGIVQRCFSPRNTSYGECRLGLGGEGRCAITGCLPDVFGPPRCEDGAYVRCEPLTNLKIATDCKAIGQTCAEGAEGAEAICTTGDGLFPCDTPGASTCSPNGARVRVCDGVSASELDCAAIAQQCIENAEGARCARAEEECSPLGAGVDVCNGNQITACVGGALRQIDCGAIGQSCLPGDASQSAHCGLP